jgi:hypothetical protein
METFTIVGSGRIIETLFEEYIGEKKTSNIICI